MDTGEVKVASEPVTLRSIAIGSCVAVVVYDRVHKIGGLAHVMLPGRSMKTYGEGRTKYAEDAIDVLFEALRKAGAGTENGNLEISIVGGANVLREGDIPDKVTKSVKEYLRTLKSGWRKERVGGNIRRSVFLDTVSGDVFYTEGNNCAKILLKEIENI